MTRRRLTRHAANAPALPGYGDEDQDHPAHMGDDPGAGDHIIGDTSDFGEGIHMPPYDEGSAPALPGYGDEDQDHPARKKAMQDIRRLAKKALRLAQAEAQAKGKTASPQALEQRGCQIMATLTESEMDERLFTASGGFLDDDIMGMSDDEDLFDDIDDDIMGMGDDEDLFDDIDDDIMGMTRQAHARIASMAKLITKLSSQLDDHRTRTASTKDPYARLIEASFQISDKDADGIVEDTEWILPSSIFAHLDTDGDGFITKRDVMAGCEKLPEALRKNCEDLKDGPDEGKGKKASYKDHEKVWTTEAIAKAKTLGGTLESNVGVTLGHFKAHKLDDHRDMYKKLRKSLTKAVEEASEGGDPSAPSGLSKEERELFDSILSTAKKGLKGKDARKALKEAVLSVRATLSKDLDKFVSSSQKKIMAEMMPGKKSSAEHFADFTEEELEALDAEDDDFDEDDIFDDDPTACTPVTASGDAEEEGDAEEGDAEEGGAEEEGEGSGKTASTNQDSSFFGGADTLNLEGNIPVDPQLQALFSGTLQEHTASDKDLDDILKPQGRTASTGPQTLGNIPHEHESGGLVGELQDLWGTAPDVSSYFD